MPAEESKIPRATTRAARSLEPMTLSLEDAKALAEALNNGTARPKIPTKRLKEVPFEKLPIELYKRGKLGE